MSIVVGQEIAAHTLTVNREGMKPMAVMLRDPNPIHWDVELLRALGLDERPVNQGPTNVAYVWDALTAWTGSVAAIKKVSVRFISNALAEEVLTAGGTVEAVDQGTGTATCSVWLRHADGTPVLTGTAIVDVS
jgi:acyl dehydratase